MPCLRGSRPAEGSIRGEGRHDSTDLRSDDEARLGRSFPRPELVQGATGRPSCA